MFLQQSDLEVVVKFIWEVTINRMGKSFIFFFSSAGRNKFSLLVSFDFNDNIMKPIKGRRCLRLSYHV